MGHEISISEGRISDLELFPTSKNEEAEIIIAQSINLPTLNIQNSSLNSLEYLER